MDKIEPKRLGLVKTVRVKGDEENPYLRLEFSFIDDRSAPASVDVRSSMAVNLAKQIIALDEQGKLGQ